MLGLHSLLSKKISYVYVRFLVSLGFIFPKQNNNQTRQYKIHTLFMQGVISQLGPNSPTHPKYAFLITF